MHGFRNAHASLPDLSGTKTAAPMRAAEAKKGMGSGQTGTHPQPLPGTSYGSDQTQRTSQEGIPEARLGLTTPSDAPIEERIAPCGCEWDMQAGAVLEYDDCRRHAAQVADREA